MDSFCERMEREAVPAVEAALGSEALVSRRGDGLLQFRVVARERLADSKCEGARREEIRRIVLGAGAACAKVHPAASPFRPDLYTVYSVTALDREEAFLAGR